MPGITIKYVISGMLGKYVIVWYDGMYNTLSKNDFKSTFWYLDPRS